MFRPALVERHAECAVNGQAHKCVPGKSLGEDGRAARFFEYLFCCDLQRPRRNAAIYRRLAYELPLFEASNRKTLWGAENYESHYENIYTKCDGVVDRL